MISYIFTTTHGPSDIQAVLDSVIDLPKHEKEIIVLSPQTENGKAYYKDQEIILVKDGGQGSVAATNVGFNVSKGDYIQLLIEDVIMPSDFLNILDFMEGDFIAQKTFKMSNAIWDGGPGYAAIGLVGIEDGKHIWPPGNIQVPPQFLPYSVIPLPFFRRDTIEKQLNGYIFHPIFKTGYCDHWLGFYVGKNEKFEPTKWRCPNVGPYTVNSGLGGATSHNDNAQHKFELLTHTFIPGVTSYV